MLWLIAIAILIFPQVGASGSTSKRRLEGSSWASGGNWWAAGIFCTKKRWKVNIFNG